MTTFPAQNYRNYLREEIYNVTKPTEEKVKALAAQITPGPWRVLIVYKDGQQYETVCTPYKYGADGEERIPEQYIADIGPYSGETSANARLIAAAPSLAAALKELANQAGDVGDFYQESDAMESLHNALSAAVDALRDAGLDAPEVSTYLAQRSALADIEGGKE